MRSGWLYSGVESPLALQGCVSGPVLRINLRTQEGIALQRRSYAQDTYACSGARALRSWLPAQAAYPSSDGGQSPQPPATTIQGCLQSANGHYTLTEKNGTVHRLSGYANKLGHQVGHEVKITGMPSVKTTGTTSWGTASSAVEQPVFDVKTVTQVADTCQAK